MDREPIITAYLVEDKRLYALSKEGIELPVYLFTPLASGAVKAHVPFIDDWPSIAAKYVEQYFPLPALTSNTQLRDGLNKVDFGSQARNGSSVSRSERRPWAQAEYFGYPLYIYGDGGKEDSLSGGIRQAEYLLFRQVTTRESKRTFAPDLLQEWSGP